MDHVAYCRQRLADVAAEAARERNAEIADLTQALQREAAQSATEQGKRQQACVQEIRYRYGADGDVCAV